MSNNWNYNLQYLSDYIENKLSPEEDQVIAAAIQQNEDLRVLVEGIERYEWSDKTLSLEAYLQETKKEIWDKLSPLLSTEKLALTKGEKSFWHWTKEQRLPWYTLLFTILFSALLYVLMQFYNESFIQALEVSSYLSNLLILSFALGVFFANSPSISNSLKHQRALLSRRQFWNLLQNLIGAWLILYAVLVFSVYSGNEANTGFISFFNLANNLSIVYLYLAFFCLNSYSIDDHQIANNTKEKIRLAIKKPIRKKEMVAWFLVGLLFGLEQLFTFLSPEAIHNDVHLIFALISGLFCMLFTFQLVAKIGSKFLSKEKSPLLLLSIYAGIQPLLVFIFPTESVQLFSSVSIQAFMTTFLVIYALFGKSLLLAFSFWSLQSNRIIKYFEEVKIHQDKDEEQELLAIKKELMIK